MSSHTHGSFTFDGPNKTITCLSGLCSNTIYNDDQTACGIATETWTPITQFSADDVYSRWKDWLVEDTSRTGHPPAFTNSVGGDDLGDGISLGKYYFIQNGWRIIPDQRDHTLTITGNLFPKTNTDEVLSAATGNHQVLTNMRTSSLTQRVVSNVGASPSDVADAVWDRDISSHTTTNTFGYHVSKKLLTLAKFIGLK